MPADFDNCVSGGGRVRTDSHGGTYRYFCYKGGKSYAGHVHHKKSKGTGPRPRAGKRRR